MLARLFVIVGGLIVLALLAALVGPYFIDWTSYRADFEREASTILGRKVTVKGDASARLLPFPSVTFHDVTVGADAANPVMTVEEFSMDAELAPFMSGEVLIFDMRLVRPKATIDVAADGTVDWAVRPSTPFAASQVSLEKLTVTEGQVRLRHTAGGREHLLSEINTTLSARALTGPWRMDGSLRLDGMRTALSVSTGAVDETGALRLTVSANPAAYPVTIEAEGDVRADKGQLAYKGRFRINEDKATTLRGSDGEVFKAKEQPKAGAKPVPGFRLTGDFALDHKRLGVDAFRFETGPLDNPYTAEGTAFVDLGLTPNFAIKATGAQVRFDEAVAGETGGLTLDQRLTALEEVLTGLPKPTMPGSVDVDLPAIVAGDTTIRDVKLSAEPAPGGWAVKSAAATLPGRATLEANGTLSTEGEFGFKGALLLAVGQPSGFAAWISRDVDDAIRKLPAAGFSAKVELSPRRQSFSELELMLGKARFRGLLDSRQPENARPSMQITLDGDALDVDGLTAFASLFVSDAGANRFADRDLDFQIKAGPVTAAGMTAESVDTALRLREGQLEIDRLSIGGLAGASVSATGSIRDFPAAPTGSVDASIVAVDLAPLVALAAERFPHNVILTELNRRAAGYAGLLSDAQIDLVASSAPNGDGTTGIAVSARGAAGGASFSGALSGSAKPDAPQAADITAALSAKSDDATTLLALAGLPATPLGLLEPAEAEISAKGMASELQTSVKLDADDFSAGFDGLVALRGASATAKGKIRLEAGDLAPWLVTTGTVLPGMMTGLQVSLNGDAAYGDGTLSLAGLDGAVNENAVSGDLTARMQDGLPHLTGKLGLDWLSLDPAFAMVLGEEQVGAPETTWPSVPFQQKATMPFTAELGVTAATLSAGTLAEAEDASLSLKLDGEGMRVFDLTAKVHGGTLAGLFDVKNSDGTGLFNAQLTLAGAVLADALPQAGVTGTGDFSASLTASGKSVAGMVAELAGTGTASLKGLTIAGVNPKAFPAFLARAVAIGRDIDAARTAEFAPAIAADGSFSAGDNDLAFTVAGGILRAPPVRFENADAVLTGDLRADLNSGSVSATGTIAYQAGQEALVGSEPMLRFALEGPPGQTVRSFDAEPLAQFLTQRALEIEQARVEAMQSALLEKQRLRREARYYAALEDERARAAEEKRRAEERIAAEARDRAAEEARLKAEAEAKAAAEAEKARLAQEAARKAETDAKAEAERNQVEEERRKAEEAARLAEADRARQAAEKQAEQLPAAERAPVPESAPQRPLPQGEFPPAPKAKAPGPFLLENFIKSLQSQ